MKALIVEDEPHAARHLAGLLRELDPGIEIIATLDSVKGATGWLQANPPPDLVFMDIQLADGLSFSIFERTTVTVPVIFTTAFDQYALRAFKVNSIDYILKPIDRGELAAALAKYRTRFARPAQSDDLARDIGEAIRRLGRRYKARFVTKVGEHLRTVETQSILYFTIQDKTTFCCTDENRRIVLDHSLEELEDLVDPERFFRVNRKYFVSHEGIRDIVQYTNSRLRLMLRFSEETDCIVARERVQDFRAWLDR